MTSGVKKHPAGPPTAGGPDFLVVGKIRRPHGVHGEMVAETSTDFPERFSPQKVLYIGKQHLKFTLISLRNHNEGLLIGFEEITSPEQAGQFRNQVLSIAIKDAPTLAEGEYFFHEMIGLVVVDEDGNDLGKLTEIMKTGANDVYVVTDPKGNEILLPAIADVILSIDMNTRTMKVHLLPGLLTEVMD